MQLLLEIEFILLLKVKLKLKFIKKAVVDPPLFVIIQKITDLAKCYVLSRIIQMEADSSIY